MKRKFTTATRIFTLFADIFDLNAIFRIYPNLKINRYKVPLNWHLKLLGAFHPHWPCWIWIHDVSISVFCDDSSLSWLQSWHVSFPLPMNSKWAEFSSHYSKVVPHHAISLSRSIFWHLLVLKPPAKWEFRGKWWSQWCLRPIWACHGPRKGFQPLFPFLFDHYLKSNLGLLGLRTEKAPWFGDFNLFRRLMSRQLISI